MKLIPVVAALALASVEAARTIGASGIPSEVVVTAKRLGQGPWVYRMTVAEADGTLHEDLPISQTAWEAFHVGDRLPARRSLGGQLHTIEMRYAR